MSVRELSEAVERLGMPIPQPVLSNLELGRRETISVAEWLVLAEALGVPPLLLVFPVGRVDMIEPLPKVEIDPWAAIYWSETGRLTASSTPQPFDINAELIDTMRALEEQVRQLLGVEHGLLPQFRSSANSEMVRKLEQHRQQLIDNVRTIRQQLRQYGLTPLPLPPEVQLLVGDEELAR